MTAPRALRANRRSENQVAVSNYVHEPLWKRITRANAQSPSKTKTIQTPLTVTLTSDVTRHHLEILHHQVCAFPFID